MSTIAELPITSNLFYRPAATEYGLPCWIALPDSNGSYDTPIIAIHGIKRDARIQAELYATYARSKNKPVIAPIFSKENWPRYQQVVRSGRADLALLDLLQELRNADIVQTKTFDLVGFSGGAQFSHRFAMLYPQMVSRLIIASAGWYTFPDQRSFPYGLGKRKGLHDWGSQIDMQLEQFLNIPIIVAVGENDCKKDRNTRSSQKTDKQQGTNRLERAKRWVDSLHKAAVLRYCKHQDAELFILPGCGHDFNECIQEGGLGQIVLPDEISQPLFFTPRTNTK